MHHSGNEQVDSCIGLSDKDASYYFTTDIRDPKNDKAAKGSARLDMAEFSQVRTLKSVPLFLNLRPILLVFSVEKHDTTVVSSI